ncbi:acetyl-CoA carboxylase biotin carboxylase subunit family protein [Lysinibacillus sp. BW-2-10]|uniref:ATP-grasp domain-containing protein n=1 Tax=Lysinibacillus sp. BW-2-10 TaxID=2590030 RepID=UPI001C91E732|nr:ATP-grasp domain-containing protein [Lysinibacillus sp. BW-2-10]
MKKILMLGGAYSQVVAIKKAREMGYYVIVCDFAKDNPGRKFANEFYNISTTDQEAVLELAASLKIDGIVCYKADSGAPTVAFVSEKLNLPSNPYESIEILTKKDLFREFQKNNNFNVPRAKGYASLDEAKKDFHNFKMPVMIKPVDSAGSIGVSRINSIELLEEKVKNALRYSRVKRFIIEEYIEVFGSHVGGDGFSVNGNLVFRCFSNEEFSTEYSNPFVSIQASWPNLLPMHIQNKIHEEIQRVLKLLKIKTTALNFDIRIDENENVYLLEIAPRNGGGCNSKIIEYATGVNLVEYTIKSALGEDCSDLRMIEPKGFWSDYLIVSQTSGEFIDIEIDEKLKGNIVECELFVKPGHHISAMTVGNEKVGALILNFSSNEEMQQKMNCIKNLVKVIVIQ